MVLRISLARPIVVAIQFIRRAKPLRSQRITAYISSSHARGAVARAPEERNKGGNLRRLPGRMQRDPVAVAKARGSKPEVRPQSCFVETGRGKRARHRRAAYLLLNNDGVLGTYETNWTVRDTDGDRLWDGFDYVIDPGVTPDWHYGELYLQDYNERLFFQDAHQSDDTDPLDPDSDDDGLDDGDEVYGWGKDIYTIFPEDTDTYDNLTSDPSDSDSDNDGLNDSAEYNYDAHPLITDTDEDGLRDKEEYDYGTIAADFDTDNDMIPDGYVENWWRNSTHGWHINTDNADGDTSANCWEGEDLDLNGVYDSGNETLANETGADTDGDGIDDGYEYFFNYVFDYMNPTLTTFTSYVNYNPDNDANNNALDIDSDGDGLNDTDEDLNGDGAMEGEGSGSYPSFTEAWEPNPYDDDTDDDGDVDGQDMIIEGVLHYLEDWDNDNLINCVDASETTLDPQNWDEMDSDEDGLLNDAENETGTDYLDPDSDNDGVIDGQEFYGWTGADDPNVNDTVNTDLLINNPNGFISNATKNDTDGDGLNDSQEMTYTANGWKLDPMLFSSDKDSLADGYYDVDGNLEYDPTVDGMGEIGDPDQNGAGSLNTNPNMVDTDEDGYWDCSTNEVVYTGDRVTGSRGPDDEDEDNDGLVGSDDPDENDIDYDDDNLPDGGIDGWNYWKNDAGEGVWGLPSGYDCTGKESLEQYKVDSEHDIPYFTNTEEIDPWEGEDVDKDGIKGVDESSSTNDDFDKDNLHDAEELLLGADPNDIDSDNDNIPDGWIDGWYEFVGDSVEGSFRDNGIRDYGEGEDLDCDGYIDWKLWESNPSKSNSDDDEIKDFLEYTLTKSNPSSEDTDNDGCSDSDEWNYNQCSIGNGYYVKDWDMDLDDKLNTWVLLIPVLGNVPDHFIIDNENIVEFDPHLVDENGDIQIDPDMDGDYIPDTSDNDWDNDGMDNDYEAAHGINKGGWQNPWIFNNKFAVCSFHYDPKKDERHVALEDMKQTNRALSALNFQESNRYYYFYDSQEDTIAGLRVLGPAHYQYIKDCVSTAYDSTIEVLNKVTENDLFIILNDGHGQAGVNDLENFGEPLKNNIDSNKNLKIGLFLVIVQECDAGPSTYAIEKHRDNKEFDFENGNAIFIYSSAEIGNTYPLPSDGGDRSYFTDEGSVFLNKFSYGFNDPTFRTLCLKNRFFHILAPSMPVFSYALL